MPPVEHGYEMEVYTATPNKGSLNNNNKRFASICGISVVIMRTRSSINNMLMLASCFIQRQYVFSRSINAQIPHLCLLDSSFRHTLVG
jgi:hypothetical protein